jgi:hypothetical protein
MVTAIAMGQGHNGGGRLIAMAMGQEDWGNGNCSGNGTAGAQELGQQDSDCNGAMAIDKQRQRHRSFAIAMALGHWGKSNRTVLQQNSDCNGAMGQ